MIDLSIDNPMTEALQRFLHAAEDGAVLRKIERPGETILYFRKNGKLDERLANKLIHGKPSEGSTNKPAHNPVLRLVVSAEGARGKTQDTGKKLNTRERQRQHTEHRVSGALSSQAAQLLAQRSRTRQK